MIACALESQTRSFVVNLEPVAEAENASAAPPVPDERRIHLLRQPGEVALGRGVVGSEQFFDWARALHERGVRDRRNVILTLCDAEGRTLNTWRLIGALPVKCRAPGRSARSGTEVAMEELVLSVEGVDVG